MTLTHAVSLAVCADPPISMLTLYESVRPFAQNCSMISSLISTVSFCVGRRVWKGAVPNVYVTETPSYIAGNVAIVPDAIGVPLGLTRVFVSP